MRVRLPKSGLPPFKWTAQEPDTPAYRRARALLMGAMCFLYVLLAGLALRKGVRPALLTQGAVAMLGFLLVLQPRIRPGTKLFWQCFGGVFVVLVLPCWLSGTDRSVRLVLVVLYMLATILILWRSRRRLREETLGWRLIFFGGMALGVANVTAWLLLDVRW